MTYTSKEEIFIREIRLKEIRKKSKRIMD